MSEVGKQAVDEDQRYLSLDFFEADRQEIAKKISDRIDIPLSEFEAGDDHKAFFHWISSLLAVERWFQATIDDSYRAADEFGDEWHIARNKLAASALLRLFHHPFALSVDDDRWKFVAAFGTASSANAKLLKAAFSGWDFLRGFAYALARYWWEYGSLPHITDDHFSDMDEGIENGGEDLSFLADVYRDAVAQLISEFSLLQRFQADGSIGVAFPSEMPAGADYDRIVSLVKRYLYQASAIRQPASMSQGKIGGAVSFEKAARALNTQAPIVLIESVYNTGHEKEAFVYLPVNGGDSSSIRILPALTETGMIANAFAFALM